MYYIWIDQGNLTAFKQSNHPDLFKWSTLCIQHCNYGGLIYSDLKMAWPLFLLNRDNEHPLHIVLRKAPLPSICIHWYLQCPQNCTRNRNKGPISATITYQCHPLKLNNVILRRTCCNSSFWHFNHVCHSGQICCFSCNRSGCGKNNIFAVSGTLCGDRADGSQYWTSRRGWKHYRARPQSRIMQVCVWTCGRAAAGKGSESICAGIGEGEGVSLSPVRGAGGGAPAGIVRPGGRRGAGEEKTLLIYRGCYWLRVLHRGTIAVP